MNMRIFLNVQKYNHFNVKLIYKDLYKQYGKEQQIKSDSKPLQIALENGYDDIVEYQ